MVCTKIACIVIQPLNTSGTQKQYLCKAFTNCFAKKYSIYCGAMIEYKGVSKSNIFVTLSRDSVHRNTEFIVMQPLNTMDTEMQYFGNGITGCCAQKYSIDCHATT